MAKSPAGLGGPEPNPTKPGLGTSRPDVPAEPLLVGRPNVGDIASFMTRVGDMIERRWFSNDGPLVQEFEEALADRVGVRHCVAVCNATVGIEIAAQALGLRGEVIVPAYTFVATAHALRWCGLTPVFADVDPDTHNIDPSRLEDLITSRTTAIVGTHVWGRPCDTDSVELVARRHGLEVMYDAAHAFGCSRHGRMIGGHGRCEVFSFHATKFLNSFEGGAVATNDDDVATRIRSVRNFGFVGQDSVAHLGTNGKMTEICAAMGLTSLESMDSIVDINRCNHVAYREGLQGVPGVRILEYDGNEANNYQYVVVEVDACAAGVTRDAVLDALTRRGVMARRYFWPGVHRMEPYRSEVDPNLRNLPHTEWIADRVIVLPTGQRVSRLEIDRVCAVIRERISASVGDRVNSRAA